MAGSHDQDGGVDLTLRPRSEQILAGIAVLLLMAAVAAVGFVPDVGIYRPKILWSRGLILGAAAAAFGIGALRGRFEVVRPAAWLACAAPALVALGWLALGEPESELLAHDELLRLGLFPLAIVAGALGLAGAGRRRAFLIALSLVAAAVAAAAVGQNLAGVLRLPIERQARALATFGNPVFLGAFLVQVTPLVLVQALYGRSPDRWLGALAGGLCLPALLASGTRSAWLGTGAALIMLAIVLVRRPLHRRLLVIGLLVTAAVLTPFVLPHLERPQQHALIWRDTLDLVADHPLGVGPGQYLLAFVPYASRDLLSIYPRASKIVNDAHSEPLQVLAELGWVGLAAAALALAVLARTARRLLAERPDGHAERPVVAACLASLTGAAVQSLASPDLRFVVTVILLGTIAGLMLAHAPPRALGGSTGRWLALAAAAGCLWLGVSTTRAALAVRPLLSGPILAASDPAEGAPVPTWVYDAARRRHALSQLHERLEQDPRDEDLLLSVAVLQHADGRAEDAMASLRRVLDVTPRHPRALAALGTMEVQARRHEQAFEHLSRARELLPDDTDVRFWLAHTALQLGDLSVAWREVDALLALRPDHPGALLLREKLRE